MKNINDNIDLLFRSKLENHEVIPPDDIWEGIVSDMEAKKRRRRMILIWGISSAASLLIAFLSGWYISNNIADKHDSFVSVPSIENFPKIKSVSTGPVIDVKDGKNKEASFNFTYKSLKEDIVEKISDNATADFLQIKYLLPGKALLGKVKKSDFKLIALNKDELSETDRAIIEANLRSIKVKKIEKKSGNWAVGIQASPAYRFDQSGNSSDNDFESSNNSVSANYVTNMTGGLKLEYNSGNRLTFQSGVNYGEVSQKAENMSITYSGQNWVNDRFAGALYDSESVKNIGSEIITNEVSLNTMIGVANVYMPDGTEISTSEAKNTLSPEVIRSYDFNQNAGYIEIPLIVRYKIIDNRFGFNVLGGINTNFLVLNNVKLSNSNEVIAEGEIDGLNTLTFSSSLGVGLNYAITDRFNLTMEPTLKMQLNSLNKKSEFSSRPYTIGIFTGLSYNF